MKELKNILSGVQVVEQIGDQEVAVNAVVFDSRKIKQNDLFVAQKGSAFDGHLFIEKAISMGATANPSTGAMKVLISGGPAHTVGTEIPMSNGDQPGVAGGIISGGIMGPTKFLMGSTATFFGVKPAARLTSMTGQNGSSMNVPGTTIAPAQTKVLILK